MRETEWSRGILTRGKSDPQRRCRTPGGVTRRKRHRKPPKSSAWVVKRWKEPTGLMVT